MSESQRQQLKDALKQLIHAQVGLVSMIQANIVCMSNVLSTLDLDDQNGNDNHVATVAKATQSVEHASQWINAASSSSSIAVVALYPFVGTADGDLSFAVGDHITVTNADVSGWWYGVTLDGRAGTFPSNYVRVLVNDTSTAANVSVAARDATRRSMIDKDHVSTEMALSTKIVDTNDAENASVLRSSTFTIANASQRWCRVLFEYTKESPDQLSVRPGDLLQVTGNSPGFVHCVTQNGVSGCVPVIFVEMI